MAADNTSTLPPTETTPPSAPVPDQDFYTWTNFFSILSGSASPKERDAYFRARDVVNEDRDCARCVKDRDWLLKYSPVVRFMQHNISLLGGDLNGANIRCKRCTTAQSGGFDPEYGMLLCANQFRNRGHMEDTMAHEMVHAYDYLRFKLDPLDLRHAACMEIRASTLSGECRFGREFFTRGQWKITQQLQECVRRRATLSVANRPGCKDDAHAARVVNEVWDSCFNDTRPFDEIYR
ncbi:Mitochondrial inner membrane protease atp23 [Taxawa tesnikishii (nom. ined.)]|nr:Mitochondrial inner membrane protease atp23 [Dothideales sp. JES 119]